MLQILGSLTDDSRVVSYDRHIFIVQPTGADPINVFGVNSHSFKPFLYSAVIFSLQ